jgi:hypothetical protein
VSPIRRRTSLKIPRKEWICHDEIRDTEREREREGAKQRYYATLSHQQKKDVWLPQQHIPFLLASHILAPLSHTIQTRKSQREREREISERERERESKSASKQRKQSILRKIDKQTTVTDLCNRPNSDSERQEEEEEKKSNLFTVFLNHSL